MADKLEPINSQLSPQQHLQMEQQRQANSNQNNRSPFLDTLFNVSLLSSDKFLKLLWKVLNSKHRNFTISMDIKITNKQIIDLYGEINKLIIKIAPIRILLILKIRFD